MAQHTSTMQVFSDKASLQKHVAELKANQLTIGFVPTMGALHEGHLSLVSKGLEACDKLIVSIFVNPTQFNEKADLDAYPRQVEKDLDVLKIHSEKLLIYTPSVSEMYPDGQQIEAVDFGLLTSTMEGKFRPGHFDGMVDIVRRLFDHSQADIAFFGQKDFQQLSIIRHFVRKEMIPISIVACPIVRQEDGLALSSRNARLSADERQTALALSKHLNTLKSLKAEKSLSEALHQIRTELNADPKLTLEYIECIDGQTFESCESWNDSTEITCCIAAYVGDIRLIDNILLSTKS